MYLDNISIEVRSLKMIEFCPTVMIARLEAWSDNHSQLVLPSIVESVALNGKSASHGQANLVVVPHFDDFRTLVSRIGGLHSSLNKMVWDIPDLLFFF